MVCTEVAARSLSLAAKLGNGMSSLSHDDNICMNLAIILETFKCLLQEGFGDGKVTV